ncbi:MAG: helix-turn-helix domain-containing protein [Opitutales bacterium]
MPAWSPILIQKIEIHALGFVLRKLQLNRHRDAEVAPHRHHYAQLILYLAGEGRQTVNGRTRRAGAGDLFAIPAEVEHGFSVLPPSRPVCLVLDYEVKDSPRQRPSHRHLPPEILDELHRLLLQVPRKGRLSLADYPPILSVVARLLGQSPALPAAASRPPLFEKVRPLLAGATPLAGVARQTGYHPDHLTRRLKRETGLGLRALRTRLRLAAAQKALREEPTVAEASVRAGFDDPNYFARWFRRQAGRSPSAFRRS